MGISRSCVLTSIVHDSRTSAELLAFHLSTHVRIDEYVSKRERNSNQLLASHSNIANEDEDEEERDGKMPESTLMMNKYRKAKDGRNSERVPDIFTHSNFLSCEFVTIR